MDNKEITDNESALKEDTCCICMELVNKAETGHLTSKCCKHLIHINCFVSYTLTNKQMANKCPMCRYDMNTGQPFKETEYNVDLALDLDLEIQYDYYSDTADDYQEYNASYDEPVTEEIIQTPPTQYNTRTEAELQEYYATPYVSSITTHPVCLESLYSSSQSGMVLFTSEKYACMATYNPLVYGMDIQYQTKPPLIPSDTNRYIISDGVPRCISIQTTPNGGLYVMLVYPDDGEADKMVIYFPASNTVIMSAFLDKMDVRRYNLDDLQITGFSANKHKTRFIYVGDSPSTSGCLLAEVGEFDKLKTAFYS